MSYAERVERREQPAPFQIEKAGDGLVRIFYAESKLTDPDTGELVVNGPWCIDEDNARRWWTNSETARHMREGNKP
jgi:hypothetical protein